MAKTKKQSVKISTDELTILSNALKQHNTSNVIDIIINIIDDYIIIADEQSWIKRLQNTTDMESISETYADIAHTTKSLSAKYKLLQHEV